jgi:hypothetical protein
MSVAVTNSVKPSYNDVAHLTLILWAYSHMLLRETWSRIWLCMSRVLIAKLTDKHLSIMTLIFSWSTTCMYVLFAFDPRQCCLLPIIQFTSPSAWLEHLSRHVPKPRTIITLKCLDTSILIPIVKNHLTTSTGRCKQKSWYQMNKLKSKRNHFFLGLVDDLSWEEEVRWVWFNFWMMEEPAFHEADSNWDGRH